MCLIEKSFQKDQYRHAIFLLLTCMCLMCLLGFASAENMNAPLWPNRSGTITNVDKKLGVDASNAGDGYIYVYAASTGTKSLKLRVTKGNTKLDYDLPSDGTAIVVPLQLGSGTYELSLYENVKGTKYSQAGKMNMTVTLLDENSPFLYPNQYVDYDVYTAAVAKAEELCGALKGQDAAVFEVICQYMANDFSYDFARAKSIGADVLPDINECWEARAGICQDLSAVTACMLRTMGIPCKLMIGYADKQYHAWTVTLIGGDEKLFDPTVAVCEGMSIGTYSIERYY